MSARTKIMATSRYLRVFFMLLMIILVIDIIATSLLLKRAKTRYSATAHSQNPIDVAFVFYGGDAGVTTKRLETAVLYHKNGAVKKVAVIGGCRPYRSYSGAEKMARDTNQLGVDEENIIVGEGSYDSISNVQRVSEIISANNFHSIAFVSDPLHLHRLEKIALEVDDLPSISFIAAPYGGQFPEPYIRANYEIMVNILSSVLSKRTYQKLVWKIRNHGETSDNDTPCLIQNPNEDPKG